MPSFEELLAVHDATLDEGTEPNDEHMDCDAVEEKHVNLYLAAMRRRKK